MTVLSPGHLHSAFRLLEIVAQRPVRLSELSTNLPKIGVIATTEAVRLAREIRWVTADDDSQLASLTATGERVRATVPTTERFRQALVDFIDSARPPWSQLLPRGREETLRALSPPVAQCFSEAGLDAGYTDDVVRWWDEMAAVARGLSSIALLDIGRVGERNSLRYEETRTGRKPRWQSIESNLSGFDILSVIGSADPRLHTIEVKATSGRFEFATFHLPRMEWETAKGAESHAFHLWVLSLDPARLAVLSVEEVEPHIPTDNAVGRWEVVEIPFTAFTSRFEVPVMAHS